MLYTNGKIVVHKNNNLEELKEMIAKVANHLSELKGESYIFEYTEEDDFPAFVLPDGVTFHDLDDALRPYVKFAAINQDEIFITDSTFVEKRYDFDQDELQDIANDITGHFKKKKEIEARKKIAVKQFDSEISEEDKSLNEKIDLHRNGYEQREYKARVKFLFKEGMKQYIDINDEDNILKTERMNSEEKKMRIDHKYEEPAQQKLFAEEKPSTIMSLLDDKESDLVDEEFSEEADDLPL